MESSLDEVPKFDMAVEEGSVTSSIIAEESIFGEENPLTKGDAASLEKTASKKPQAMALHGWQRTVAVDEDFAPTIQVCLGAPGTGLMKPPLRRQDSAASCGQLDIDPQALGRVFVTWEDKKEAKSLRALPVASGAAPLPFPRVVSETDESSLTESLHSSTSLSATTPAKRHGRQEHSGESPTSTTSSDLNFLVKTSGTSSFFGTRASFGRSVEPRIPATVGEERLHNSLAKFFTEVRRDAAVSLPINEVGESGGESCRSSDSQDKEMSGKSGTVTSTPVTKPGTRESSLSDLSAKLAPSSLSDVKLKLYADSRSSRQETKREDPVKMSTDDNLREKRNARVESTVAEKLATRQSLKESASMEQRVEGGLEGAEASRSVSKCGCFSAWPWKVRNYS